MRSSVLISRIVRQIETAGASGDGAALAEAYASAVVKVNGRLEAAVAAADSKLISDAIRIVSEDPPLLEEVSTLDFFQLPDWECLCDMNGWKTPPKIDKQMTERVVEIGEAKDAIAPFLTMYKKAVRVNDVRLAVKSLRRLADLDSSQDWSRNLKQSERQLQALIVNEFLSAKDSADEDACDRLAHELLDGAWKDGISVKGADDVRAYCEKRETDKRDAEGRENVAILKKCVNEKWDRKLALSLVQAIDGFVDKGWKLPEDDKSVVDACRERCAKEFEQEEADRRFRAANETLHAAIQKEDCEAIRNALSAPEFLDRDPVDGMLGEAQTVLDHADAAKRRKTLQIAACALFAVLAVLGVSGWWLRQKLFLGRCEDEAAKLEFFERQAKETPGSAIKNMSVTLERLKSEAPEVYEHPKVNRFEARLNELISENCSRTNQLVAMLNELEEMNAQAWSNIAETASVTSRMDRISSMLAKDDNGFRSRFLTVKDSWNDKMERKEAENRDRAVKFHATLVSHLGMISSRLTKELARRDLKEEIANCRASLEEWKGVHGCFAEDLSAKLTEAERSFNDALEEQRAYTNALEKLLSAREAIEILEARCELAESFGNYPETKLLKPVDVGADEVKDVLSPEPSVIKTYLESLKGGVSEKEFDEFISEKVLRIADSPGYYSLYGLRGEKDPGYKIIAITKGKPDVEWPRPGETLWKISCNGGSILSLYRNCMVNDIKTAAAVATPALMPSSVEMRTVVEGADRGSLTAAEFENDILKLIKGHLLKSHADGYVEKEVNNVDRQYPVKGWFSPYRRVQFVAWYMGWLKDDLKTMPKDAEIEKWYTSLDRLATDVKVDGVDDELAWLCLWDERIRRRNVECAKMLNRMPADWVERYKAIKQAQREVCSIGGWKISCAGKVSFDPLDPAFEKEPDRIVVSAPNVVTDHPLYVLRKVDGKVVLLRAFEPGKNSPWRKCFEVEQSKDGYLLGEPLYHVFANGSFIDVQKELSELAKREEANMHSHKMCDGIPIFTKGGK